MLSKSAFPAIFGGMGSGKSQAATLRLCHLITQDPGIDVSHFFPSYRLAKRRGLAGTKAHLSALGIAYSVNKQDLTINLTDFNSTIYLETYHDPDAIMSFEVAHAVVDELDTEDIESAENVWTKISERVRQNCTHPAGNTVGCVSTPNQGTAGYCYKKWGDGQNIADGYHYIKAGTRDNKFIPAGYAEQIAKNYDPIMAEAYLNGGWVSFTKNKVYHFYNRLSHNTDRAITDDDRYLHTGLDFNVGGCCAVTYIIDNDKIYAVDEFVSYDTRDIINNLSARYKDRSVTLYPDASGGAARTNASQSDINLLREAGYQVDVGSINPPVRDRINAFNGLISHNRFYLNHEKAPRLAVALESQGYDKSGQPEKWDTHPAVDDWVDAAGYMIARRFPIRFEPPQLVMPPTRQHNPYAQHGRR